MTNQLARPRIHRDRFRTGRCYLWKIHYPDKGREYALTWKVALLIVQDYYNEQAAQA